MLRLRELSSTWHSKVRDFIEEWQIINSTTRSVAYTKLGSMNWALTRDRQSY